MLNLKTYSFKPIQNLKQNIHIISISERISLGKGLVTLPHRTDFYIILIITNGNSSHMIDFNEISVSKGDVLFMSPGQVHAFREGKDYEGWIVAYSNDFLCSSSQNNHFIENANIFNNFNISNIHFHDDDLDNIIALVFKIISELKKEVDQFQKQVLHNFLYNLLMFSERKFVQENIRPLQNTKLSQESKLVADYKKLIRENYKSQTKVKFYTTTLSVSERLIQKATMNIEGKSPKQLINDQIILESKRLLVHEVMTIKEISYFIGFKEPTNFTKFFKKHVGMSPNRFKIENNIL